MAKKKTFRVYAKVITYCYIDIEADSKEDAEFKASKIDGGDFISDDTDYSGDFLIAPANKRTKKV